MRGVKQLFKPFLFAALAALASCAPPPGGYQAPAPGTGQPITYTPPTRGVDATREVMQPPVVTKVVKVALLVPMTGRSADLGKSMQDAATLALYDRYAALSPTMASTRVEILPKDTGDTPEGAAAAARSAIEDGAEIILGPVFGDALGAVKPVARKANIQVISFSNNRAAASSGAYVFGFSPEQQTARIVSYMIAQKKQVAALVPNTPLGQTVLAAAKQSAEANGSVLAPVATYLPRGVGIAEGVDALVNANMPFSALLLPEVGSTLNTAQSALSARGISATNTQIIGTGLWDDPAVITQHSLEGAMLASSPPAPTQGFVNRFRNTYGYTPPRIASLAYDAVALTVTLATSGRPFDAATLTQPGGFAGPANGAFRFREDGTSDRALAVMKIVGGNYEVVSPPPTAFK